MDRQLPADVPDKAGELASDRHAHFVLVHVPGAEAPIALRAAQLRAPGNVADRFGLPLLALL